MTATGSNVVFVLADNLGVGDLSCYAGFVPPPRLDGHASQGMRFDNFNTEALHSGHLRSDEQLHSPHA